eukprot:Tbor_TRINITY_DN5612_c0_g1::TRINITY_DN5612_c0_g1_i1::g.8634::m.8634/K20367/ERGIC3, ERV46; endoplasmic reticulum-Golgi intermediate compartment protein 3
MANFRMLDVFPKFDSKFERDARDKTTFGAFFSIVSIVVMAILTISEVRYYFTSITKRDLFVDPSVDGTISITLNISFPHVPCDLITIDSVDYFGVFQEDIDKTTVKHRINREMQVIEKYNINDLKNPASEDDHNASCGSCYGADRVKDDCCNTCDDVKDRYRLKKWVFDVSDDKIYQCAKERQEEKMRIENLEGCNIHSRFSVSRVQGNIHLIPGKAVVLNGMHLHDLGNEIVSKLNLSHVVNELSFGERTPGMANPLDNHVAALTQWPANGKFQYFIKVVPTRYENFQSSIPFFQTILETYQYSVTEHFTNKQIGRESVPGIFFMYDLSPIKVRVYEVNPYSSVLHFILQLCAICGGVFTVAGLIDAVFYHNVVRRRQKMEIGKLS